VRAQTPDGAKDESKPEVLVDGVDSGALIALDSKFSEVWYLVTGRAAKALPVLHHFSFDSGWPPPA
jgi:hypothetical protein